MKQRPDPKPGQVYKHFKGNEYVIVGLAKHTETEEQLVIYTRSDNNSTEPKWCARPLKMFMSKVDKEKYPDVKEEYRFTLKYDPTNLDFIDSALEYF